MAGKATEWNLEMDKILVNNLFHVTHKELSKMLGLSRTAYGKRLKYLLETGEIGKFKGRKWSDYETDFLLDNFDTMSLEEMSKALYRTVRSIECKMRKLNGTTNIQEITEHYTTRELILFTGLSKTTIKKLTRQGELHNISRNRTNLYDIDEFWDWVKTTDYPLNYANIKHEDLYCCPEWFIDKVNDEKRKLHNAIKLGGYSSHEEALVWSLFLKGYTNAEIAKEMNRTRTSIRNKLYEMKKQKMGKAS